MPLASQQRKVSSRLARGKSSKQSKNEKIVDHDGDDDGDDTFHSMLHQHDHDEFSNLSRLVMQLKKESLKHLDLEVQAQTEFEALNAQMRCTRTTMGKLAEIMNEDLEEVKDTWMQQLREYQIETTQRFADLQNAIERLEFRFVHHVRDCQVLGDTVDRHQDGIAALKLQLSHAQVELEKSHEQNASYLQELKFASLKAEERAGLAVEDCSKRIDAFQERLVHFANGVETEIQANMDATRETLSDFQLQNKRTSVQLHKTMDDVIQVRSQLSGVETLGTTLERHQKRIEHLLTQNTTADPMKWARIESALEAAQTKTNSAIRTHEIRVKSRLESISQTLALLAEILYNSDTIHSKP